MIAIATGYDMLDQKIAETLGNVQIVNYREFLLKNKFDIVVISRHLIGNVEMENLLLILRQNNTRIIFLTEEDNVREIRLCLDFAIYDMLFDPIDPTRVIDLIENPRTFADIKRIFVKVNSSLHDDDLDFSEVLEVEKAEFEQKKKEMLVKQQELEERQRQIELMSKETDDKQKARAEELRQALAEELNKKKEELEKRQAEIEEMQKNAIEVQKKKEEEMRNILEAEMEAKRKELEEKQKHLEELKDSYSSSEKEIREALESEMDEKRQELEDQQNQLEEMRINAEKDTKVKEEEIRKVLEKEMAEKEKELEEKRKYLENLQENVSSSTKEKEEEIRKALEQEMEDRRKELEEKQKQLEEIKRKTDEVKSIKEDEIRRELQAEMENEKRMLEERKKTIEAMENDIEKAKVDHEDKLKEELQMKLEMKQKELEEKQRLLEEKQKQLQDVKKTGLEQNVITKIEKKTVYKVPSDYKKVIVIISPESTGKTTIAVNLAYLFSKEKIKTTLIDCDFENKDIYFNFNKDYSGCMSKVNDHERILDYGQSMNEYLKVFSEHRDIEIEASAYDMVKLVSASKKESQVVILDIGKDIDSELTKDILEMADNVVIVVDQRVNVINRLPQKLYPISKFLNCEVDLIINKYENLKYLNEKSILNFFNDIEIDEYAKFNIEINKVHTVRNDNLAVLEGLMSRMPAVEVEDNKFSEDFKKIVNSYYMPKSEESALKKIFDFLGFVK